MKNYRKYFGLSILVMFLAACSNSSTDTKPSTNGVTKVSGGNISDTKALSDTTSVVKIEPVEKNAPETDYKPAFEGQIRIKGVVTETKYKVQVITDKLDKPWAVTSLPDGRLIVTEKGGSLRIVDKEGNVSGKILGFPEVDDRGQGGLLDVVLSPDFDKSRLLFFTLAEKTKEGSVTAVGKGKLSDDETKIENFTIIYRALPYYNNSMHFGSRLVFDDEGFLYVSTGERSDLNTRKLAQKLDNGYGKILKITVDGTPAPNNPFLGNKEAMPEIFSYGHRNVQGMDIDPITKKVFVSEMGPRGGDELNLIVSGANYGWGDVSYGIEYSGQKIGEGKTVKEGTEQPIYYWDPVIAPSGMTFYKGTMIPEWTNNLFIGGLRGSHIARLVLENGKVVGEERLLEKEGQRFRDIGEGIDGALYAVTDQGRLYKISK